MTSPKLTAVCHVIVWLARVNFPGLFRVFPCLHAFGVTLRMCLGWFQCWLYCVIVCNLVIFHSISLNDYGILFVAFVVRSLSCSRFRYLEYTLVRFVAFMS